MPAPDYRDWTIIGHNGVPTAGCSINLPVMQRPDGTITLLSLGPFGVLSRDTREDVEEFAKQGLLTLFPDGIHVALPPEAEGCQEDYPTVLSISQGFAHEVNPGKGTCRNTKIFGYRGRHLLPRIAGSSVSANLR